MILFRGFFVPLERFVNIAFYAARIIVKPPDGKLRVGAALLRRELGQPQRLGCVAFYADAVLVALG